MANVIVCGSGTFISSLLFKLKNARGDAEGFLLGEILSHQVENITDSQSEGHREEKEICLHSFVCLNRRHSFYSRTGSPDVAKLHELLGDRYQDVVGWFSYRRNSSHRVSMTERAVHTKLATCFTHLHNQDYLLALVTEQLTTMSTICSTEYSFQYWDGRFIVVSSKLSTLPPAIPYQLHPTYPHSHPHYTSTLQQQRSKFTLPGGDVLQSLAMEDLCAALLSKLQPLSEELLSTSRELQQVSSEVAELREAVSAIKRTSEWEATSNGGTEEVEMEDKHAHSEPPDLAHARENGPVIMETNSIVNTGLLVDIDTTVTESHDQSHEPPGDLLSDCLLVSESANPGGGGGHTIRLDKLSSVQDSNHQCLSQELF